VDSMPGSGMTKTCDNCSCIFRLTRTAKELVIKVQPGGKSPVSSNIPLTPELLQKIRRELPDQPWESGIHKKVAINLGIAPKIVSRAIQQLIASGDVNPQINGTVFVPKPVESNASQK
jgi:hypothetical protein